jgi:hypothetical protein
VAINIHFLFINLFIYLFIYLLCVINKLETFIKKYFFDFVTRLDAATLSAAKTSCFQSAKSAFHWSTYSCSPFTFFFLVSDFEFCCQTSYFPPQTNCFPRSDKPLSAVRRIAFRRQTCQFALSNKLLFTISMLLCSVRNNAFRSQTGCFLPSDMLLSVVQRIPNVRHIVYIFQLCFYLPFD